MTRSDFVWSGSVIIFGITAGTTCHDRPYLSFSQPQGPSSTALRELAPEVIDFGLRLAANLQRDRLAEFEIRTTIQSRECLSLDFEFNNHDRARLFVVNLLSGLGVSADFSDLGILEDRAIEFCRFLGLRVEPQARRDLVFGDGIVMFSLRSIYSVISPQISFELLHGAAPAHAHAVAVCVEGFASRPRSHCEVPSVTVNFVLPPGSSSKVNVECISSGQFTFGPDDASCRPFHRKTN